ncbi:MarR family winged helix-turn-helix transcriptional regulator [Amycolatopsis suaedae]|uniref:MarR family winged helix-turn-helix transcriptional regulator n=1 Tax=Amycolatopsis suaedae TaxID=2510978 RepID=UPI0013EF085D|nr:MarR family transcriptional regulator [Amycolatopsis suaedae]
MSTETVAWKRLLALHNRVEHELARVVRRHGLGLTEFRALDALVNSASGSLRIQELAGAIGLDQSSVSRLVARLERDELSERDICEDDRRGVYTAITEHGRSRHAEAEPDYAAALKRALDEVHGDPELTPIVTALRG